MNISKFTSSTKLAFFTVVSNNYLHFARTLLQTVSRHHPSADVYCVIVDRDLGPSLEYSDEFSVLRMEELKIPGLRYMVFQYNILELNTAVKPWAFETLLNKGYESVIYLDPDIFVYRPLSHVIDALSAGSHIVITPHLLSPIKDDKRPTELDIRRAGTYNFGFCAVRRSDNTLEFLRWWQGKLARDCIIDQDRGIFVDQSWIDLAPGLFDNVFILRNPAYNIAYWNVAQRSVKQGPDGDWTVDGEPLVFFHFSGFNPLSPEAFSKHQNRFTLSNLGPPATLARNYASALIENGAKIFSKLPYGYATFSDGAAIPDEFRRLYLQNETLREQMGDDPFIRRAIPPSDRLCYELFRNLLDRNPTPQELDWLRGRCRTKLGATVALIKVARRPESRNRPKPTRRFKKAMRAIWRTSDENQGEPPSIVTLAVQHRQAGSLAGLYAPEPGSAESGVWCGAHLSVPLGNAKHDEITISGIYDPSALARMNGRGSLSLELQLDGHPWQRIDLPESGEIEISGRAPDHLVGSKVLQINADSVFVPSAIGYGGDQRELAWRLKKIQIGDLSIFDSRREQPVLPMSQIFPPEGVNLIGYVFAELGVGEACRTMARAAKAAAIPYSLYDVGYQTENRQTDRRAEANATDETFAFDIIYVNADQTPNTLQYLSQKGRPRADYRIGFWHWEQPRLPEIYWSGFEGLDEIWVPTAFVQEAVSAVSPLPVFKVPHAVDFSVEPRWTRASFGIPDRKFAVLVMYDFHSYRYRKNPEAAIAAFKLAARGRSDMALVVKTINASKYAADYAALKADVADLDSVVFIDEVYSREQIYALEASCDCMLSLHRAEGFGFGPAEMMFLGKPVIATGWSGNMEFMTHMNSFPVNYELKPLAKPLGAYVAGLEWAEPDVEHAASCLRQVVEQQALAFEIGKRAQHTMRTRFSPEVIGKQYRDRLASINMHVQKRKG